MIDDRDGVVVDDAESAGLIFLVEKSSLKLLSCKADSAPLAGFEDATATGPRDIGNIFSAGGAGTAPFRNVGLKLAGVEEDEVDDLCLIEACVCGSCRDEERGAFGNVEHPSVAHRLGETSSFIAWSARRVIAFESL